ncbi:MAG TPA: class I SAM-dependent methyltransferase [Oscillatoriaceae cyanobacterium]
MTTAGTVKIELQGVEETMLIPLWGRAKETRRPDALFRDARAVEMVEAIDYDFARFERYGLAQMLEPVVSVRTELLDKGVSAFLAKHPDATIINLGAGLDTRFFRLDNGRLTWFEVDLPRSMALRKQLMPEGDRHPYVTGSVLETDWLDAIGKPKTPVLIIAEGLFMYLEEPALRTLVARLAEHFPGAELLFETNNPLSHLGGNTAMKREGLLGIKAELASGLWHGRELEGWVPGVRWIENWCYFDYHPERWGPMALCSFVPFFRSMLRIEHVKLP